MLVTVGAVFTIWRYAWLSDDALITLRTSLNWAHGYGPVFNPGERVAGYTHPLWMGVLTVVGMVSGSWITGALVVSIVLAGIAVAILVFRARNLWQFITITCFVLLSDSLVNWGTSGLEGPLALALLGGLFVLQSTTGALRYPIVTGFVAGLLLLCRLDYLLLIAPWFLWTLWRERDRGSRAVGFVAGLVSPLLAWAWSSFQYYGFVLPSTFEAKTNSTIGHMELIARGAEYLRLSFGFDPTVLVILFGVSLLAIVYRERPTILWAVGTVLYLSYVLWVGGDYMLGRFLLAPAYALMLAVTQTTIPDSNRVPRARHRFAYVIPLVAVVLSAPTALVFQVRDAGPDLSQEFSPIVDERTWWVRFGRSLDPFGTVSLQEGVIPTDLTFLEGQADGWPSGPWSSAPPMVRCGGLGAVGFLAPRTHIIDSCGLTDRFMAARTYEPPNNGAPWKAGHFDRQPPTGYLEAVEAGDPNLVEDPALARELAELWAEIRK